MEKLLKITKTVNILYDVDFEYPPLLSYLSIQEDGEIELFDEEEEGPVNYSDLRKQVEQLREKVTYLARNYLYELYKTYGVTPEVGNRYKIQIGPGEEDAIIFEIDDIELYQDLMGQHIINICIGAKDLFEDSIKKTLNLLSKNKYITKVELQIWE